MEKKDYIATLQELLQGRNEDFDNCPDIALVRHADNRKDRAIAGVVFKESIYDIYRYQKSRFMCYQSEQLKGSFDRFKYIVTCLGEKGTTSRFLTVYRIKGINTDPRNPKDGVILDLEEVPEFAMLSERIVFDWGKATVSWKQDFRRQIKPVLRIDEGIHDANGVPQFVSYADTLLTFPEMTAIFQNEDEEWKSRFTAVNCIYLIQDRNNGKQYVGSTYGKGGIWGRWQCYVTTGGHGNNAELQKELGKDAGYADKNLHWCILETLPINIPEDEAIDRENLYKRKFMTRQFGYNKN